MIAVISSGDHDGPQPPLQHAVSAEKSNTSTLIMGSAMSSSYPTRTAPPGQNLAQIAHPVHSDSSTSYPFSPGYRPPGTGLIAFRGQTRLAGHPGDRSHASIAIRTLTRASLPYLGGAHAQ